MVIEVRESVENDLGLRPYVELTSQWSERYATEDRYTVVNAVMRDSSAKLRSRLFVYDNTRLGSLSVACNISGHCLRYELTPVSSLLLSDVLDDDHVYEYAVRQLNYVSSSWRLWQKRTGKDLGIVPERVEFDCDAERTIVIRSAPDIQSPLEYVADESGVVGDDVMANIKQQYSATGAHRRFVVFYGKVRREVFAKTAISIFDCHYKALLQKYIYASGAAPQYYALPYPPYYYRSYTEDPAEIERTVRRMILPHWAPQVDAATEPLELIQYDNGHRCLPYIGEWQLLLDI